MLSAAWKRGAILASAFFLCGSPAFAGSKASQLPDGPGKKTFEVVCSGCHPATIVLGRRDTKQSWALLVSDMVNKGATGTDAEFNTIIDYLAKHFPKNSNSKRDSGSGSAKRQSRDR